MVFKKIIFQNRYVALQTPSRPPPFMAKTILNFHFDFLNRSLIGACKILLGGFFPLRGIPLLPNFISVCQFDPRKSSLKLKMDREELKIDEKGQKYLFWQLPLPPFWVKNPQIVFETFPLLDWIIMNHINRISEKKCYNYSNTSLGISCIKLSLHTHYGHVCHLSP